MGTTPTGIPYPEDTDPVAGGAQAMKAIAGKVAACAAGTASITTIANGTGQTTVTLPAGRFTAAPGVTAICASRGYTVAYGAVSASSFIIYIGAVSGSGPNTIGVYWTAVQTG